MASRVSEPNIFKHHFTNVTKQKPTCITYKINFSFCVFKTFVNLLAQNLHFNKESLSFTNSS